MSGLRAVSSFAIALLFFASALALRAQSPAGPSSPRPADVAIYGAYPEKYQEIITAWLETQLLDAESARIEWLGIPKAAELKAADGKILRGYQVDFRVNSRNQFGAYTGMQKHGVLIRDGAVVKGIGFGY